MKYTVHLHSILDGFGNESKPATLFDCGFYWINPQGFFYCEQEPLPGTPDHKITRGFYPLSAIASVQVNVWDNPEVTIDEDNQDIAVKDNVIPLTKAEA